jgi:predicted membrane channel-forming protein YqfA (hemolysin III family)
MRIFSTVLSWVFRIIFAITLILGIAGNWYDLLQTQALLGLSWQGMLFILFGASSIVVLGQLIYRNRQLEGTFPNIVLKKTENILGSVANFVTG